MARSLLREAQIRDEDNMSEAEHDAWVHINLVCSGTVTVENAPVMLSGTGDIYCNELHTTTGGYATTGELITTSGVLQDQIDSNLDKYTRAEVDTISGSLASQIVKDHGDLSGLSDDDHTQYLLVDGSRNMTDDLSISGNIMVDGDALFFGIDDSNLYIKSLTRGDNVNILGKAENGIEHSIITGDPDGKAKLYYNGIKTVETSTNGIDVYHTSSNNPGIYFYGKTGVRQGIYQHYSGHLYILIGPANKLVLQSTEDAETGLYYNDSRKFETTSVGAKVTGQFKATNSVVVDGGELYIGDPMTNGSWRFMKSGGNLIVQERRTGAWATSHTFT